MIRKKHLLALTHKGSADLDVAPPRPRRGIKLGDVYFIKMVESSLGAACGAKTFLYFKPKTNLSMLFLLLGRPQGQKVEAFWLNTYEMNKNDK